MVGSMAPRVSATVILPKPALQRVLDNLCESGFRLIGPAVRNGALILDAIRNISELPIGWTLEQKAGSSHLLHTHSTGYFGCSVGPHSWKRYLFPPRFDLLTAHRNGNGWTFEPPGDDSPPFAFIGVRSCDLHAISIQDDVFVNGAVSDPHYARRRERAFILAVNCNTAASTCFCTSMKTGPRAPSGFDLALTELPESFVIEIGSEAGSNALAGVDWQPASAFDLGRVTQIMQRTERQIQRQVTTSDLPQLLYERIDHPYWDGGRPQRPDRDKHQTDARVGFLFHSRFFARPWGKQPSHHQVALPPVDDPQAGGVDRSVRPFRLCGVRALHCMVPGGN
jgi:sulfhydrogenase subunit beta (sulfur reductase)